MQIRSLRIRSYRSWAIDDKSGPQAQARRERLEFYRELKDGGCSQSLCLKAIGWSRATYYRWLKRYREQGMAGLAERSRRPRRNRQRKWTAKQERAVLALRDRQPLWGKRKIAAVLRREGVLSLSESTVGRILQRALARRRIWPASSYAGRAKPKRRRVFRGHAQPWRWGMKAHGPGRLVQVDHMSVNFPGCTLKNFTAVCPVTGYLVSRVYSRATSANAVRFLEYVLQSLPFPVLSLQVDGGSEFRGALEEACRVCGIGLYVLPPRSPKWNGCVERAHRSLREEFYTRYRGDWRLRTVNRAMEDFQKHYCHYRPHGGRGRDMLTPMEYYRRFAEAA